MCMAHRKMRYAIDRPQLDAEAVKSGGAGDWRSGSALRSHRRGHWFDPSIAHPPEGGGFLTEATAFCHSVAMRLLAGAERESASGRCPPLWPALTPAIRRRR